MAILSSIGAALGSTLSTALASKGVAAAGAAVLMVGGGVAIAQSGPGLDRADTNSEAELTSLVPHYDEQEGDDEQTAENGELLDDAVTVEDNGENGEENGDEETTSQRVHRALTGDAVDDGDAIGPGHPDFAATVAERAQNEHLGEIVSEAARGDNGTNGANGNDNGAETAQNGEGAAPSETPAERAPEELPEQSPQDLPDQASDATDDLPEEAPEAPPEHAPGPPEDPGPGN